MTESEAKKIIGEDKWPEFEKWMYGQTVGIYPDGSTNYYEYDVRRFAEGHRIIYD